MLIFLYFQDYESSLITIRAYIRALATHLIIPKNKDFLSGRIRLLTLGMGSC